MKGIIIDGVAASGKTTILKHLHNKINQSYPSLTKFFISEHYTERMLEHLKESGKLDGYHIKKHVDRIIKTLSDFQDMLDKSKFSNNPRGADIFVTLERFILTHLASMYIEDKYSLKEVQSHFRALNKLGIKQVALIVPKNQLRERIISTLEYRNEKWKEHLASRGGEKENLEYYSNWQDKFLDYIDKIKDLIDTTVIEVKNNDYEYYCDTILRKFNNDE